MMFNIFQSAYKIFDPSRKNGTIDIPTEPVNYRLLENYCATLAHKTNHSFLPNAEFVCYDHPKYGVVPCLTSNHDIQAGNIKRAWLLKLCSSDLFHFVKIVPFW